MIRFGDYGVIAEKPHVSHTGTLNFSVHPVGKTVPAGPKSLPL